MRKILVLRGGALGDFIVTLPALALLRERWPEADIELVGNATAGVLARNRGLIDAVHSQHEGRWAAFYLDAPLAESLAAWLTTFDLVISFWPDPEGTVGRHFPLRKKQVFLSAPALPTQGLAAAHYSEPLRRLGLAPKRLWFPLTAPVPGIGTASVALHPGSGSSRKNWPADRWVEVIEQLRVPVTVILGEAEVSAWEPRRGRLSRLPGVTTLVNPPLETLVETLVPRTLFLGHDSGVSHLAAATGIPCVLLFGPTDPAVWAPPPPGVRVLRRGASLDAIAVTEVLTAAREFLPNATSSAPSGQSATASPSKSAPRS